MKYLLTGNGINIQFDRSSYTTQQIVLRILKNCDRDDFPSHIIVNFPYLLKNYFGLLFLEAREIVQGKYDAFVTCNAEKKSLNAFKEQYSHKIATLRITDIGFEDYYLIHDLVCHKTHIYNPNQFYIREAMKVAYLFAIYNDGNINKLSCRYPEKFKNYLNSFNSIFTTNYDSNIESVVCSKVFHIHGQFDKLSDVYNIDSFRNQLPDCPVKEIEIDGKYLYLYSNALSTHCGEYKELQLKQHSLANDCVEKMSLAYKTNKEIKAEVDKWTQDSNKLTANLGYAIQMKVKHPELHFSEEYHFDKLKAIDGDLEILGLSPWNDFHIFEAIDYSSIDKCIYYYYDKEQCNKVRLLLPKLNEAGKIVFQSTTDFWRTQYEE